MNNTPSGIFVQQTGYKAFIPNHLPPNLTWSAALVRSLSDADHLVGRLSSEGRLLPNPNLLIRPFIGQEAVLSSRIEGTQATLGELLARDAGLAVKRSPDDLREVSNYVMALEYGMSRLQTLPLSLRLVRELHERLMSGVRGDTATPGEFRRSQNWIGPAGYTLQNATYVPPPPDRLIDCLGAWETFLQDRQVPPLVQAGLMHYQFEAIHPFLDGNGRVGRLLVPLLLMERKVLVTPILYLSAFFEATRREYYDRLLAVSLEGRWEPWLAYFLNGVARMSEDVLDRTERINALLRQWSRALANHKPKILLNVIDLFAENPYWNVKKLADRLSVAFTTVQRAIKVLEDAHIVQQVEQAQRHRVYCARAIMDILDEPARIDP